MEKKIKEAMIINFKNKSEELYNDIHKLLKEEETTNNGNVYSITTILPPIVNQFTKQLRTRLVRKLEYEGYIIKVAIQEEKEVVIITWMKLDMDFMKH